METIKSFSDLKQSRKLAEILPLESADMTYYACVKDWRGNPVEPKWGKPVPLTKKELALPCSNFQEYAYLSCWSLASLLGVLPYPHIEQNYKGKWICRVEYENTTYLWEDSNPVDACVAMIEKLNELNLL